MRESNVIIEKNGRILWDNPKDATENIINKKITYNSFLLYFHFYIHLAIIFKRTLKK